MSRNTVGWFLLLHGSFLSILKCLRPSWLFSGGTYRCRQFALIIALHPGGLVSIEQLRHDWLFDWLPREFPFNAREDAQLTLKYIWVYQVNKGGFWVILHLRINLHRIFNKICSFRLKFRCFWKRPFWLIEVDQYPVIFPNYLKGPNIPLLSVPEVWNVKLAYRKSWLANFLMILNLTFKVKGGSITFKWP